MLDSNKFNNIFHVTIKDKDGNIKYTEDFSNKVTETGMNGILDVYLRNQAATATWYVGIFENNYTPVETATSADIGTNITECTSYAEAVRQTYVPAAAATKSITNSASRAVFSINATKTLYGMFLSDTSTKSANTGTLFSVGQFSTSASVSSGDTIEVTYTLTLANQ